MDIYIDIETLRSPEEHRLEILKDTQENFKAPSTLTKTQAAKDLGLTDSKEIKFTSASDMIARWEDRFREEKAIDVAQDKWEKTSFDPNVAPIACICIGYHSKHGYQNAVFETSAVLNEAEMLAEFHAHITSLCVANNAEIRKPNFIGHNIVKFDLPFIWKRSVINNVSYCKGVKWVDAKHGYNCFDTMIAWAGFGNRISADNLCKLLDIKGKGDIDGPMVYDLWQKDPKKVIDYCHDDVQLVKELHERLTK